MNSLRRSLTFKLFLSHVLVAILSILVLGLTIGIILPNMMNTQLSGMNMNMMSTTAATPMLLTNQMGDITWRSLRIAMVIGILISLVLSYLTTRQITIPIRQMVTATRHIGQGKLNQRIMLSPLNADDELGQLATSFNDMTAALEQNEQRRMELIGDVTHEMRTPLTVLEGYLEGLLDGDIESSEDIYAKLLEESSRLRRIINDLQELSRAEAHQIAFTLTDVSSADLLQQIQERLQPLFADKQLALIFDPQDTFAMHVDYERTLQILTNLMTNALRYTPSPGCVKIIARQAENLGIFEVHDTGIGLTPEQQTKIFERFYRVDKSRARALGGHGIGLTISRALAESMHGSLTVSSKGLGQGSTFAVSLPLAARNRKDSQLQTA